jgi:UPF0176 protein
MVWTVAALYRFARVDNLADFKARLSDVCAQNHICGTLIVAHEGINGTIAAPAPEHMDAVLDVIHTHFDALELKMSEAREKPFQRMKIKIKPEIVTMRAGTIDPTKTVGTYVEAKDWNALIADPDVLVIDTRNSFEFEAGTFERAVDPGTTMFCEFPDFVREKLDPAKHTKIAMFCTGGIRCEKASSLLVQEGFREVYHLKGGILKYLEDIPADQSLWKGKCFVFDERETLEHGLREGGRIRT